MLSPVGAQSMRSRDEIGPIPESRVYDHDNVYRSKPEVLARMSEHLKQLKVEHDFDAYLVVHSGLIGIDVVELANSYRKAWIDDKSDGLVFVMDIQSFTGGDVGRSRDL
ncbi:hypothetical protein N9940_00270 [bacterium]|nr:hypothetical protein [Akkermansiaceae bacterium]MDB4296009.1 hypothetical protein [bacterium]MDB4311534.1 hypothetical protein [bacterium]MDB4554336.1 hypothetical protein [Akkermansiaceae bacterium]MDB4562597.1 hypothetical protein [Akkermansiaceae bacterium]